MMSEYNDEDRNKRWWELDQPSVPSQTNESANDPNRQAYGDSNLENPEESYNYEGNQVYSGAQMSYENPTAASEPLKRPSRTKNYIAWVAIFLVGILVGGAISIGAYALGSSKSHGSPIYVAPSPNTTSTVSPASGSGSLNISQIVSTVEPAVVTITGSTSAGLFSGSDSGTGMIITPNGYILTNAHVVSSDSSIKVSIENHGTVDAVIVGEDISQDVAVIRVSGFNNLPTVELANSSQVTIGEPVVAIGNALALPGGLTVTSGIISALDRSVSTDVSSLSGLIQTDAPINPGNSGGPLLNAEAQVIGMNTAIASGAQNIGFAIPTNNIKPLLANLESGKSTQPNSGGGFLGVSVQDASPGAYIISVVSGSPAARAGLQPGDIILSVDSTQVISSSQLASIISSDRPGQVVTLTIQRGIQTLSVKVTLGSKPTSNT
jgi:serine protease Do